MVVKLDFLKAALIWVMLMNIMIEIKGMDIMLTTIDEFSRNLQNKGVLKLIEDQPGAWSVKTHVHVIKWLGIFSAPKNTV